MTRAGFALNCMTLLGVRNPSEIQNLIFELPNENDGANELEESVICEPKQALELLALKIAFGVREGEFVDTTLEAVGYVYGDDTADNERLIPIAGRFQAKIVVTEAVEQPVADDAVLPLLWS